MLVLAVACAIAFAFARQASAVSGPPGFVVENAFPGSTFFLPVQIVFMPNGNKLVVEQGGVVWMITAAGQQLTTPFIDLSAKVLRNGGRGLLGVALDPEFTTNRWVYFAYTVDPDSSQDLENEAYARVERYQADLGNPSVVNLSTRQVLIGTQWSDGIPTPDYYHTIGSLRFGADQSLLVASGEAAHFDATDAGGIDTDQFLPGRADPSEDLGSFRSLTLNSLGGKILRLDKNTGHGLPSNPYWNGDPVAARSRVWTYGVRNPYRFAVRPGTGQTDPSAANPGTLYIGDTGWNTYEAVHLAQTGGLNMGWPCQEGPLPQNLYGAVTSTAAGNTHVLCGAAPSLENPVGPTPPLVWWHHLNGVLSYPEGWTGYATVGGVFHSGSSYPAPYAGSYFVSDYSNGWIRYVSVDENDQVIGSGDFITGADGPVDTEWDPVSGDLFYVSQFNHEVRRIRYALSTQPRALHVRADSASGAGPPSIPGAAGPWTDLALDRDLAMTGFDGTPASGWQGNGTVPSPYRLNFDGVDDRLTIPAGSIAELQSPTAATIALWVRTGPDVNRAQCLVDWVQQYAPPYEGMSVEVQFGLLRVYLDGGWFNVTTIRPSSWYHVGVVKGPGSVRVFLNGVLVSAGPQSHLGGQVSELVLGAATREGPGVYADFFEGSFAQATVFPTALTDGEILALSQAGSPLYFPPGPKVVVLRADSVSLAGPPAVPGAASPWKDLIATHDADLAGFDGTTSSGWQGTGGSSSPFRLEFDGLNDRVTIPAGSVSDLQSPTGYTAGIWVQTGADVTTSQYLFEWVSQYAPPYQGAALAIQNGALRAALNPWVDIATVQPHTWYHFVIAKDASGVRVYVDGLRRYLTPANSIGAQNSEVVIGASTFRGPGLYDEHFQGAVGQFTIWKRGLIDPEVQEAYSHDASLYSVGLQVSSRIVHLKADSANGAGPFPIPGVQGPWTDLISSHDGGLTGFAGTSESGWQGVGVDVSPYRLEFDGIDDRVTIPAGSIPELQSPEEASVSSWFRTGTDVNSTQYVLEWVAQYSPPFPGLSLSISNGQFRVLCDSWVDAFPVLPETWYHVVVAREAVSTLVYMDGQFMHSSPSANLGGQLSELVVGASTYGGAGVYGEFFRGSVAAVSVWPMALSAAAANQVYVADSSGYDLPVIGVAPAPTSLQLSVRPNPFRRSTSIALSLERRGEVDVTVYSVDGRRVRRLASGPRSAGAHVFTWDGSDGGGRRVQAGVYFVRVEAPGLREVRRVALLQ